MKTEKMLDYFIKKDFAVKLDVPFTGDTFTLATATLSKVNGKKRKVILHAEGIARRSCTQSYDLEIGKGMAVNRAMDSLMKKFRRRSRQVHLWCEG